MLPSPYMERRFIPGMKCAGLSRPAFCNNTSVGIIVRSDDALLMLERMKFPYGVACPAGHVDNEDGDRSNEAEWFQHAAVRELREETGLQVVSLQLLIEQDVPNRCRRPRGTWHRWKVYQAKVTGQLTQNTEESKRLAWYSRQEINQLACKTKDYCAALISEDAWQGSPGLEPVWYDFLVQIHLVEPVNQKSGLL